MYKELLNKRKDLLSVEPGNLEKIKLIKKYLKIIPPSYYTYLLEIGHGGIPEFDILGTGKPEETSLIRSNKINKNLYKKLSSKITPPKEYVLIMDIGYDISWYFDLSTRRDDGECKVVGWIGGLAKEEQPEWLKEEETFDTFEDFFRSKVEE